MAGQSIGAAMVADTIVLKESLFHTVTNDIPYFRSWIQAGKEAAYAKSVEQALVSEYMVRLPDMGVPIDFLSLTNCTHVL